MQASIQNRISGLEAEIASKLMKLEEVTKDLKYVPLHPCVPSKSQPFNSIWKKRLLTLVPPDNQLLRQ
jgi:hypothetical protein